MARAGLSKRQQRMMEYIIRFMDETSRPPSIREIGKAINISSTSVVNYNLNRLVEEGYLERDQNVSRGIRLTDKNENISRSLADIIRVPLVGRIFASEPVPLPGTDSPIFDSDEAIELTREMLPANHEGLFALEVRGDSMIDAMVNDGDIVVMRQVKDWSNGDMVAVWLRDKEETTLKHIYREGARVRLQPANPTMEPIMIHDPSTLEVQGKVVMVVRQMEAA
jgi:repressor LexA